MMSAGVNVQGMSGSALGGRVAGVGVGSGTGVKLARDQAEFSGVMSRTAATGGRGTTAADARAGAEQFVSIALVQPILKQLRESTMAVEPFKPNAAERTFRTMHDAAIAERLVRQANWPLVDRVARDVLNRGKTQGPASDALVAGPRRGSARDAVGRDRV